MKKNYIILPVFNDWQSLKKVLRILDQSFRTVRSNNYIIIVNDFSSKKNKLNKKYNNLKNIKILNLRKNVGSQKAIFFGLKYLQKIIKKKNSQTTISVLDSDGEDNPKMLKKLIELVNKKKDYFIFASRKERTENNILKALNQFRLFITYALTGKFINFGNFSSFSSKLLKKILSNNNLYLAYSAGVLKNYNKFFFIEIKKNKRLYGNSKVNFQFLLEHTFKIISVFYLSVFFRSLFLILLIFIILESLKLKFFIVGFFIITNLILIFINIFLKPRKINLSIIKSVD
ncbi:glycosyltransferase [Pelagibacteraceae bacterium]|nr:glycosyltransferase [Pelagibacteraceae bacterium]